MAITTIDAVIRMRRGLEDDLDITKLQVGEWALSTDKKWVRICYAPSHVIKIASQEAMDETLEEIRGILNTIEGIEDIVEGYKNSAEGSATNASSSASAAASSATASANSATLSQSWAVGGTGTRSGENTNNSKYYAEQARQYTPEGYQDFVDDINYLKDVAVDKALTPTSAIITNGVAEFETLDESRIKGLTVEIKPDQDLHGYDHPWVGGAGKNKLPLTLEGIKSLNTTGTWSGNVYTINGGTITVNTDSDGNVISIVGNGTFTAQSNLQLCGSANLTNGTSYTLNGCPSGGSNSTFRISFYNNALSAKSDTGSGVTFTYDSSGSNEQAYIRFYANYAANNVTFYPMIRLASITDASFEPYENKCPIYGHDKCDIADIGKNKLPLILANIKSANTSGTWNGNVYSYQNITLEVLVDDIDSVLGIKVNGTSSSPMWSFNLCSYVLENGMAYKFNGITNGSTSTYRLNISGIGNYGSGDNSITGDGASHDIRIQILNGAVINETIKPMLRLASNTDSTFVPYRYQKVTISLGDTIYGGTLDVLKGLLTITHKCVEYDGSSDEGWYKISGENRYYTPKPVDVSTHLEGTISNNFKFYGNQAAGVPDGQFYIGASNLGVRLDSITSVADWKTFLSNNLMQIVYPLATAIVIQINPTVMKTLLGEDNLSASTGDVLSCIYTAMMNSDDVPTFEEKTALDGFTTVTGGLLSECKVTLEPVQDLHGYDSPWVGGANVNKFPSAVAESKTASGVTVVSDGHGIYSLSGIASADAIIDFDIEQAYTIPQSIGNGGQGCCYFFNNKTYSGGEFLFYFMDGTREVDSWSMADLNRINSAYSAMSGQNCNKVRFKVFSGTNIDGLKISPMFSENGLTTNPFTWWKNICPISGHTQVDVDVSDGDTTQEQVTVNLGGTYYSGVLDVVTGVFTPDTAVKEYDGSVDENWGLSGFYANTVIIIRPADCAGNDGAISEQYKGLSIADDLITEVGFFIGSNINIHDDKKAIDVTTWKAYLANHPLKICYKLATPTPIQLSPTTVKALVGENHLSAPLDGQEITEVKFREGFTFDDVVKYVQSMLTGADE